MLIINYFVVVYTGGHKQKTTGFLQNNHKVWMKTKKDDF